MSAPEYLFEAASKPSLPWHEVPLIRATDATLSGYGCLVDDPDTFEIEITRWPQQGWRPIDDGTGDEGGYVEGTFKCDWRGDVLYGENEAVKGRYVLGWSADPQKARTDRPTAPRDQVLLWHMNYHPDGGQMFYPLDGQPFIVPAALPGDNLSPDKVVAFWSDGTKGIYIHAGIWHEGVFPVGDSGRFLDRQGAVHARVSADIGQEFGVYLSCPLDISKLREV
ncbi:ureidoglycolate lyase [Roseovarius sp. 2305UL8-3]|uniref:ureidoglycolate lyase n=1 Tax=Roseovarius conchicola TaxID=3121636 RepID=UPI003529A1BB